GGGVGDLPAEEGDALPAVGVDHQALLAIVHAEGEARAALVDALQAEEIFAVARPVAHVLGANPDIAQRFDAHDHPRSLRSATGAVHAGPKNRPSRTKPPAAANVSKGQTGPGWPGDAGIMSAVPPIATINSTRWFLQRCAKADSCTSANGAQIKLLDRCRMFRYLRPLRALETPLGQMFAAVHDPGFGTKRTRRYACPLSAFGEIVLQNSGLL